MIAGADILARQNDVAQNFRRRRLRPLGAVGPGQGRADMRPRLVHIQPEGIGQARDDFMLLLPVNTRFIVSLRQVDLGGFVNAVTAMAVAGFALHKLGVVPDAGQLACFALLIVAGILIHYSLMLLLATMSFWTVRAQGIVWGYYSLFNIARYPDAAFRGLFKMFFTFAVPMLLVANVPARVLASTLHGPARMLLVALMCVLCFIVSEIGWRFALRHYTSASS